MSPIPVRTKYVQVPLTAQEHRQFRVHAAETDQTMGEILRRLVQDYLQAQHSTTPRRY